MRLRTGFVWTLAAGISFAFLLIVAGQPGFAAKAPAGMSAPAPPARSVESMPAAQFLAPQFDSHAGLLQAAPVLLPLAAHGVADRPRQNSGAAQTNYCPLYRRPPPSFS
jgi:hypothetical protein